MTNAHRLQSAGCSRRRLTQNGWQYLPNAMNGLINYLLWPAYISAARRRSCLLLPSVNSVSVGGRAGSVQTPRDGTDVRRETGPVLTVEAAASDAVALPAAWLVANTRWLVVVVGLFASCYCPSVRRCVHSVVVDRTVVATCLVVTVVLFGRQQSRALAACRR